MENVTDALKMAGAMMIFVGAITITIFVFSKAREASTGIMAQYDKNKTFYNLDNVNVTSEREVGIDAVISNLYSYYQTQNTIVFFSGKKDDATGKVKDDTIRKVTLYTTKASPNTLEKSSLTVNGTKDDNRIFGLDINDEAIREEQWVNGEERRKQFVDFLINKKEIPDEFFSTTKHRGITFEYNFGGANSLLDAGSKGAKFIERIGEYNRDLETSNTGDTTDEGDVVGQFNGLVIDSSIIRFKETNETIDNSKGDKKKIIEYIYIE